MKTPGDADLAMAVSVASSDTARTIINILGKIDQVGKVITDVSQCYVCQTKVANLPQLHPYANVAWNVLNAAQRVRSSFFDNLV